MKRLFVAGLSAVALAGCVTPAARGAAEPSDPVIGPLAQEWRACVYSSFRSIQQQVPEKYQAAEMAMSRCTTERDAIIVYLMQQFNDPAFATQAIAMLRVQMKRQLVR